MTEQITYFEHYSKTDKPWWVSVNVALDRIQTGSKVKDRVLLIRQETDKDKRRKLKDDLPCICFAGKFKMRKDDEQITHSGFAIFDFDHVDVQKVKLQLALLPFVFAAFISPSGDGVKALVRIPPEINHHRQYYISVAEELGKIAKVDSTSQNPSRICFESYDPEIYINLNAIAWLQKVAFISSHTGAEPRIALFTDYSKVNAPLTMIRQAQDGQKHEVLLKASKLMGGLIAGGYVNEDEGFRLLFQEISAKEIDNEAGARKTINDGIEFGKNAPIRDDKIVVSDNSYDFVSEKHDEKEYMDHVRAGTLKQGLSTGIAELDPYFRLKPENFVIINGHDNVGKSSFLWYLTVKSNLLHGWKWILFCAENREGQVRKSLMQFKTGRSIIHLNDTEYQECYDWAYENFTIIKIAEHYTCRDLLNMGEKLFRMKTYHGMLIDPYNALSLADLNNLKLSSHEYHYEITAQIRSFCKRFGISTYLNCHAVTEALRRTYKGGLYDGHPMPPNKADTEGGGKFSNRADDFITIHRLTQHPSEFNITQIHVRKIKETETGGRPTLRDEPVKLKMEKGKIGFFPVEPVIESTHDIQPSRIGISKYEENELEYENSDNEVPF